MTSINQNFFKPTEKAKFDADVLMTSSSIRWHRLCEKYLPVKTEDSIWRFSRDGKKDEPPQGWKLHVSATILEACDVFERVAPFLTAEDAQFKAPNSLDELSKINCGLDYGYAQVGKFVTVYCADENQAVRLAERLDELTREFVSISVPFDEPFGPESSVFYRYGAFAPIEMIDEDGRPLPAIKNPVGELVHDDRFRAVPEWISDPFQNARENSEKVAETGATPLATYRIFRAITQRGKGGTYQAFDFSSMPPRLCVVKEGRRHGEVMWNGHDGYYLVKNEFEVLNELKKNYADVPQIFSSFELSGNFYLVMEHIEGQSLNKLMRPRRRRFSIKQVLVFASEIAKIIEKIHRAGWVWNDCKPANLIVTPQKTLKPIDFEGAYPVDQSDPFDWKTKGFSTSENKSSQFARDGRSFDLFALGAVVYFLLTGKLYDADAPVAIAKLRRRVPPKLVEATEKLLSDAIPERRISAAEIGKDFEVIGDTL